MRRLILILSLVLSACAKSGADSSITSCSEGAVQLVQTIDFYQTDGTIVSRKTEGLYCTDGCMEYRDVSNPKIRMHVCD